MTESLADLASVAHPIFRRVKKMPRCRRFAILDGMILVAAAAISFWSWKASDVYNGLLFHWPTSEDYHVLTTELDIPYLDYVTDFITQAAVPFLMPVTFAFWCIRLRKPRPILRRLGRQPGFAATSAVVLVVCVDVVGRLIASTWVFVSHIRFALEWPHLGWSFGVWYNTTTGVLDWIRVCLFYAYPLLGSAVAASWAVMALGRSWRGERGWIDQGGILLGCLWIVVLIAYCLSYQWM